MREEGAGRERGEGKNKKKTQRFYIKYKIIFKKKHHKKKGKCLIYQLLSLYQSVIIHQNKSQKKLKREGQATNGEGIVNTQFFFQGVSELLSFTHFPHRLCFVFSLFPGLSWKSPFISFPLPPSILPQIYSLLLFPIPSPKQLHKKSQGGEEVPSSSTCRMDLSLPLIGGKN